MAHTLDSALLAFGRFVREHYGIPPTTQDYVSRLGYQTTSAAHGWLTALERAGYITHATASHTRDLVLTREGRIRLAEIEMGEEVTAS